MTRRNEQWRRIKNKVQAKYFICNITNQPIECVYTHSQTEYHILNKANNSGPSEPPAYYSFASFITIFKIYSH